jgi:type III secretion system YscQ/HrcQ family protein
VSASRSARPRSRLIAQSRAHALSLADVPAAEGQELTNPLYSAAGVRANGLIWFWQSIGPAQLHEWIRLSADDARMQIALDGDAVGLDVPALDWRSYTGDTRLLAWTARHEPILELLRVVFQRDWISDDMADREARRRTPCVRAGFSIHRTDGVRVATGIAVFPTQFVASLAGRPEATEPRINAVARRVPARLRVVLDEVEMTAADLAALARGCVVRLDNRTLATDQARVALATGGGVRLIADINDKRATVVGFAPATMGLDQISNGGMVMADDKATSNATPSAAGVPGVEVGAIPVRLSFSAGGVMLPFEALRRIAPGYVFELGKRLDDQAIAIHANDVPIAVGELVAIGDLIGVRITRMLPQG